MDYEEVDPGEWEGVYYDQFTDRYATVEFPGDGLVVLEDVHYGTEYHDFDEARFAEEADNFEEASPQDVAAAEPPTWRLHLHDGWGLTKRALKLSVRACAWVLVLSIVALLVATCYVVVADTVTATANPVAFDQAAAQEQGFDVQSEHVEESVWVAPIETEVGFSVGYAGAAKSDDGQLAVHVVSVPDAPIAGVSAHPLRFAPMGPILERAIEANAVSRVGTSEVAFDGETKRATEYTAEIESMGDTQEVTLHVARFAHDGDLIIAFFGFPSGADHLEDDAYALLRSVER